MGTYSSYAVRDPMGNIVGYSSTPGQIGAPSQAYLDIQNQYNQQHYATIGGLTPVMNPMYSQSINPGAFANNALGIAQQVGSVGSVNPGILDNVLGTYKNTLTETEKDTLLKMYPTKLSGAIDEGRSTVPIRNLSYAAQWNIPITEPKPMSQQPGFRGPEEFGFPVDQSRIIQQQKPTAPVVSNYPTKNALGTNENLTTSSALFGKNWLNSTGIFGNMTPKSPLLTSKSGVDLTGLNVNINGITSGLSDWWSSSGLSKPARFKGGASMPQDMALGYTRGKYKPKISQSKSQLKKKCRVKQNDNETELLRMLGISQNKKPGKKPSKVKHNFVGI